MLSNVVGGGAVVKIPSVLTELENPEDSVEKDVVVLDDFSKQEKRMNY